MHKVICLDHFIIFSTEVLCVNPILLEGYCIFGFLYREVVVISMSRSLVGGKSVLIIGVD
jgi:hypothetical protein